MNDQSIEQEVQAKGIGAPRITPADVDAEILAEHYFTALEGVAGARYVRRDDGGFLEIPGAINLSLLTFCVLVLRNGTKIIGINHGPVDPSNFDAEYGRKDARENAIEQVWPLLGFRLRDELARPVLTEADALADLNGTPRPS